MFQGWRRRWGRERDGACVDEGPGNGMQSDTDGGNVWGFVIVSVGQYVDALQLREGWRVSISLPGSSGHQVANWWWWVKEIATYMISEKPMRRLEFFSDRLIEAYGKRYRNTKNLIRKAKQFGNWWQLTNHASKITSNQFVIIKLDTTWCHWTHRVRTDENVRSYLIVKLLESSCRNYPRHGTFQWPASEWTQMSIGFGPR